MLLLWKYTKEDMPDTSSMAKALPLAICWPDVKARNSRIMVMMIALMHAIELQVY